MASMVRGGRCEGVVSAVRSVWCSVCSRAVFSSTELYGEMTE